MKLRLLTGLALISCSYALVQPERLMYHDIQTNSEGKIIPWFSGEIFISQVVISFLQ